MNSRKQQFDSFNAWVLYNRPWLSEHPNYDDRTFRAHCYDTLGRHCADGDDFRRARDEKTFPVKWLWPDEIGNLALDMTHVSEANIRLYVQYLGVATILSDALKWVRDEEVVNAAAAAFADLATTCPDIEVNWSIGSGYKLTARGKNEKA